MWQLEHDADHPSPGRILTIQRRSHLADYVKTKIWNAPVSYFKNAKNIQGDWQLPPVILFVFTLGAPEPAP